MKNLSILTLAALLVACGPDEQNEARLFLDRIEQLEVDALDERRRRIDALANLPLESERVKTVRDLCVPMHEAVWQADDGTQAVRQIADELERLPREERTDRSTEIEAALEQSESAVARVAELREPCAAALAELRARHSPRR